MYIDVRTFRMWDCGYQIHTHTHTQFIVNSYTTAERPLKSHDDKTPPTVCTATERALLLALALKWRTESRVMTAERLREFEKEIWLSHIHATIEEMEGLVCVCHMRIM